MSRLRVLLIAEACNPTWPSVPLVGYNFARALAERDDLDITLATHVKNLPALRDDPLARRVRLHVIDNEWLARPMYRLATRLRGGDKLAWTINTALAWPSYVAYEHQTWRDFRRELRSCRFDLIHRLTPLSPTLPSPLAAWSNVSMLVGPLNGGLPWPKDYPDLAHQEREWLAPLRPAYRALPYYRSTYRHLAGVIAGSRNTAGEVPRGFRGQRFYLPENGIDPATFSIAAAWTPPAQRFRFITVGRLVPYKGLPLTLEAFAGSTTLRQCELHVVGDGPLRPWAEQFIREHQLTDCVRLTGWVRQQELSHLMRQCQAFVFPSLREFGGGVVLEAMASALPPIVVDYGGPGELVSPECGVPLPLQPRDRLVADLRATMQRLATDPGACRRLAAAAVERVRRDFTWASKAARVVGFYRATLAASAR